jgi:hypothetical protein
MARTQRLFDLLQILRRHRRPTVTTELNFVLLYVDNPQLSAAFSVEDSESVRELYKKWGELKLRIAQAPTELDFGFTFVAHCGAQCGSNAARFTRPLSREHARSHFITSSIQC